MTLTTDRNDPRLSHGIDEEPAPQAPVYLVLPEEERAKGYVRPLRRTYVHRGTVGPKYPLRDLDPEQAVTYGDLYAKYEPYPPATPARLALGRFWTQAQLDAIGKGCGSTTTMAYELAATYARNPAFYGATYCVSCRRHLPVAEFAWVDDGETVGS